MDPVLTLHVGLSIDHLDDHRVLGYDLSVVDQILLLVQLADTLLVDLELTPLYQLRTRLEYHAQTVSIEFADEDQGLGELELFQPALPFELLAACLVVLVAVE